MSRIVLGCGMLLLLFKSNAQVPVKDSLKTILLDEVVISENLLKSSETGLEQRKLDTLLLLQTQGESLPAILRLSGVQIRSYGANGLSTPSFRGTGGSHTSVLWNGINLQSPLSGQQDLSLVPIGFVEEVRLQKGGAGSLYGSGAIGGTIQLENKSYFDEGLSLSASQQYGSFANHYQGYKVAWSNKYIGTSTKFFRRKLKNDYKYLNKYEFPQVEERREHAAIEQWGILHQNNFRLSPNQLLDVKFWFQDNKLEVPNPVLAGNGAQAVQKDRFARGLLSWNLDKSNFSLVYKQAYLWHRLLFTDPNGPTQRSTSTFRTWINRLEADFDWINGSTIVVGANHNYEQGLVSSFGGRKPVRNNTAFYASLRYPVMANRLQFSLNAREELIDGKLSPFVPSLGLESTITDKLRLKGSISRNYRIPTFNDLYWQGAGAVGNAGLKAELSWNVEGGFEYDLIKAKEDVLLVKATVFNSLVDNWILWHQTQVSDGNETSLKWTPANVKKVHSIGVETRLEGRNKINDDFSVSWNANYSYTQTTNAEADDVFKKELDKQLPYTPLHEFSLYLGAGYKSYTLTLTHTFTGEQFTDGENNRRFALKPYQLFGLSGSRSFNVSGLSGNLRFAVNNLFDIDYENRRGYPMPGRNFSIGLDVKFHKQSNHD